jgi:hypothetical protein
MMRKVISSSVLLGIGALGALGGSAYAGSTSAGEEFLSTFEAVPPNVLFLLDMSSDMDDDCGELGDSGDTSSTGSTSGTSCFDAAVDAIDKLTQHFDWATYGVIGTAASATDNGFYEIAALGSSNAEISTALSAETAHGGGTRNIAEALADASANYFTVSSSSGTGFSAAPFEYWCQETHVITIALDYGANDDSPSKYTTGTSMTNDVKCNTNGITTGSDKSCLYDNVVDYVYNKDHRSDLSGDQNVITHTIAIKVRSNDPAESLFGNSVDEINNDGTYAVANSGTEILGKMVQIMGQIRTGFYSRSAPVISSDGAHLIYSFYEIVGSGRKSKSSSGKLAEGHVRAYEVGSDPADTTTYGQVQYDGSSTFGGALWDAGDLLVSRPVEASESNPDDQDGLGQRDIYTFVPELMSLTSSAVYSEANSTHRMGFDAEFADALSGSVSVLDNFLDTSSTKAAGCSSSSDYDLNDDCLVDSDDMQALIDFARGLPTSTFRFLGEERGYWKLGDAPHSTPVVVTSRNDMFSTDTSYKNFLKTLENSSAPDIVLIAANDGMLHAFRLEDDSSTSCTTYNSGISGDWDEDCDEAGEELWAWVPSYLLYRDPGEDWSGRLLDLMWYGRTFLFDGSPVVEDVWIDDDDDNTKASDGSEWHRIVVVQQGKGGPVTLALDITDPQDPQFLWEQTNTSDYSAMGYTVSRPVIANIYDAEDLTDPRDRWVAMWGGGRGVPYTSSASYYKSVEPNLYMWHVADDYWGTAAKTFSVKGSNIETEHPEYSVHGSSLDMDSDGLYEYGYISGALAAIDVDADGDADVIYFPVTVSYEPKQHSDPDGDGITGLSDPADPGFTWVYKALIDTTDPDAMTWCEFYDPYGDISKRPEVYYAVTASWLADGNLGLYWGTGTPYDRTTTDKGYFFAMKDTSPLTCSTAVPLDCGTDGVVTLDAGEGLTGDPIVYAGTVYFTTYVPDSSDPYCTTGEGRVYGLAFDDCTDNIDGDEDGDTTNDPGYITVDGYPSSVTISEQGTIFYGSSAPDTSKSGASAVGEITAASDPFMGTRMMGIREVF